MFRFAMLLSPSECPPDNVQQAGPQSQRQRDDFTSCHIKHRPGASMTLRIIAPLRHLRIDDATIDRNGRSDDIIARPAGEENHCT